MKDYDALSPVVHVEDPSGRGPVLEQLLDHLDPIFERSLPPTAYVWGDGGVGKSAVVTALFDHLDQLLTGAGGVIHTTTRARSTPAPDFVYVDARVDDSEFALYHTVLDALVEEQVPKQGVRTDSLRSRLMQRLSGTDRAVVAVDHVDEFDTLGLSTLHGAFDGMDGRLSWIAVGRTAPEELSSELLPPEHIHVPPYQQHALVDLLTGRASDGLARQAFDHEQIRRIAEWAKGDAHDALTALFGYAGSAGMARFAETGSMLSGFSPKLARVLVSGTWFVAWVKVTIVGAIAFAISVAIALIPVVQLITVVVTPVKIKYLGTVFSKQFADAYASIYAT